VTALPAGDGQAGDMLVYYMQRAWTYAGLQWDGDNEAEVRSIIDLIHDDAVRAALRAVNPDALV
jgi:hypothetical protein